MKNAAESAGGEVRFVRVLDRTANRILKDVQVEIKDDVAFRVRKKALEDPEFQSFLDSSSQKDLEVGASLLMLEKSALNYGKVILEHERGKSKDVERGVKEELDKAILRLSSIRNNL